MVLLHSAGKQWIFGDARFSNSPDTYRSCSGQQESVLNLAIFAFIHISVVALCFAQSQPRFSRNST